MLVRVVQTRIVAEDIMLVQLTSLDGSILPEWAAGAHIDLLISDKIVRKYSLCGNSSDRTCYEIAVLREQNSRGGSEYVHARLKVGDEIEISRPFNHFKLSTSSDRHLFLAGGIGITPIISMIRQVSSSGKQFDLHYCTRNPARTAFLSELGSYRDAGAIELHFDEGDPAKGLDIRSLLREVPEGVDLYYCGPPGFMRAIKEASSHWPADRVHFELFGPSGNSSQVAADLNRSFHVKVLSSGAEFEVPPNKSIAEVLIENGIDVQLSCREGYCGTCMTPYVGGQPDHRDELLDDEARQDYVLLCCTRSKSDVLIIDI
ncbi:MULTISPECIES: PDR/VanB family oxidoreductase [unclassified Beijerinckia]|uniref:PDR/VanB family oxidoreductase n=1 Tax=unclassified Beijerinckia TaxID=2638183 RepID=UPI00089A66A4|nr:MULTISPECIES: PDR/VanB family oxidoreductase [unclassified Beijerinckia]MDH7799264.1 ferredoxin-NADP reductase [Beijerinckia sp. GAS462]SED90248.1 vanillate O-demethylase ferredoxin subunit [Beijerinckia sp. 28-YEA-48]